MVPLLFQITNLVTHSTHDPPYEVSTINVGDPYYVDRDYAYASLPVFMQYLNGIKTGEPPTDLLRRKGTEASGRKLSVGPQPTTTARTLSHTTRSGSASTSPSPSASSCCTVRPNAWFRPRKDRRGSEHGHRSTTDRRILEKPAWLNLDYVDRHEETARHNDNAMGYFEVYSALYLPGTICTGANGCTQAIDSDTGCSMYTVMVAPQEW